MEWSTTTKRSKRFPGRANGADTAMMVWAPWGCSGRRRPTSASGGGECILNPVREANPEGDHRWGFSSR